MRVTVVPWDPQWSVDFESVKRELAGACGSIPVRSIEHVGSTSVLAAGAAEAEILRDYPYLTADDLRACLVSAAAQANPTR